MFECGGRDNVFVFDLPLGWNPCTCVPPFLIFDQNSNTLHPFTPSKVHASLHWNSTLNTTLLYKDISPPCTRPSLTHVVLGLHGVHRHQHQFILGLCRVQLFPQQFRSATTSTSTATKRTTAPPTTTTLQLRRQQPLRRAILLCLGR